MTCNAASHQGAIKEPAASLLKTSETHPVLIMKWIKKVNQSCPKTRTHFGFRYRTTLMKGFDPLQMLTTVVHPEIKKISFIHPRVFPNLYAFLSFVEHKICW